MGTCPSLTSTSLWQMPHASTLTSTFPAPGAGTGLSTSSKGPPGRDTCTARIVDMAASMGRRTGFVTAVPRRAEVDVDPIGASEGTAAGGARVAGGDTGAAEGVGVLEATAAVGACGRPRAARIAGGPAFQTPQFFEVRIIEALGPAVGAAVRAVTARLARLAALDTAGVAVAALADESRSRALSADAARAHLTAAQGADVADTD